MKEAKPGFWSVPREWPGERCFIIAGGESVRAQQWAIPQLKGRIIAIKQSVMLRPDADVMFVADRTDLSLCKKIFPLHTGKYLISRKRLDGLPERTKFIGRTKAHNRLSTDPRHVAGLDSGSSCINLAYLFGAREIVLMGFDMTGGRWLNGVLKHFQPFPPQEHFRRHTASVNVMAKDLEREGCKVWNASPISTVTCFEKRSLEDFL